MKILPRLGLLALVLTGSSVSVPESAAACSCVERTTRQTLQLVSVEALDGGEAVAETAFWPEQANLVHAGSDDVLKAENLEIILSKVQP